jgi:uncharacterized protein (TIGR00251 family)
MVRSSKEPQPYANRKGNLVLKVKAFPGSERNAIVGLRNGELVMRIQAPAVKGKANRELVKFLASSLSVSRSEIEILSGESSRHKLVRLPRTARSALEAIL